MLRVGLGIKRSLSAVTAVRVVPRGGPLPCAPSSALRLHQRRLASSQPSAARSPYAVLGLPQSATAEQVKLAYYKLAMEYHPDQNASPDASAHFAEVGRAYSRIMGEPSASAADDPSSPRAAGSRVAPPPADRAFPEWVYRVHSAILRATDRFDRWLPATYASEIFEHLKMNELAEALQLFEEMRLEGEQPTHAVYEMLIRGCTINMTRVGPGASPDHLTANLLKKSMELWEDMVAMNRKPDYWTYNELIRCLGKAGAVKEAMQLFEQMCGSVRLLPEERAFNSMYELCVLSGHYEEALQVFEEHEEMRKSLWKPRFTPVSFSLLLTAAAEGEGKLGERLQTLPRVLRLMGRHGVIPRAPTCERLLDACLRTGELQIAEQVLAIKGFPEEAVDGTLIQRAREQIAQAEVQAAERRLEESTTTGQLDWRIERGPDLERSGIKKAAAQNESK